MINVDLRRYGEDKDYEKAVNSFLKGDPLTLECEFEKDSVEKLKVLFSLPEDIQRKIIDIYNYMATNKNGKIVIQFEQYVYELRRIYIKEHPSFRRMVEGE